jgi:hypothetical protein
LTAAAQSVISVLICCSSFWARRQVSTGSGARASDDLLRVAVAAYLTRYKGLSRAHTDSDLQVFLRWYAERDLDPLAARRVDVELFVRWLQEVRRFKPSTVSRRLSVKSASTAPASSTRSWTIRRRLTYVGLGFQPSRPRWGCRICSSRR